LAVRGERGPLHPVRQNRDDRGSTTRGSHAGSKHVALQDTQGRAQARGGGRRGVACRSSPGAFGSREPRSGRGTRVSYPRGKRRHNFTFRPPANCASSRACYFPCRSRSASVQAPRAAHGDPHVRASRPSRRELRRVRIGQHLQNEVCRIGSDAPRFSRGSCPAVAAPRAPCSAGRHRPGPVGTDSQVSTRFARWRRGTKRVRHEKHLPPVDVSGPRMVVDG